MSETTVSKHGDTIAFDRHGDGEGPTVVFVAGAGPWREIDPTTSETARLLAARGINALVHDRVGRGESFTSGPISLEREVAALDALLVEAGGRGVLCGHSSGCSIALYAAVTGLPVSGLALWEAPLAPPGSGGREWADEIQACLATDRLEEALRRYMVDMPDQILEIVLSTPAMIDQAGSLAADAESLAWAESAPHADLFGDLTIPVAAYIGSSTYDVMRPAAESIAAAVPGAEWHIVDGAEHSWDPAAMADELEVLVRRAQESSGHN